MESQYTSFQVFTYVYWFSKHLSMSQQVPRHWSYSSVTDLLSKKLTLSHLRPIYLLFCFPENAESIFQFPGPQRQSYSFDCDFHSSIPAQCLIFSGYLVNECRFLLPNKKASEMLLRAESVEGDHALVPSTPETTVRNTSGPPAPHPLLKNFLAPSYGIPMVVISIPASLLLFSLYSL